MAGAADYNLAEYVLNAYSTSVGGSPQTTYIPVPYDGTLVETQVAIGAAITVADSTITVSVLPGGVAASAVTVGGTVTVVQSGSAAGKVYSAKHTTNRRVRKGDSIRLVPAGATTTSPGTYSIRIER